MSWTSHIRKPFLETKEYIHTITKNVASSIASRERIRTFISIHTLITFYQGFIEPHLDYCWAVWNGLSLQLTEKLQKLLWRPPKHAHTKKAQFIYLARKREISNLIPRVFAIFKMADVDENHGRRRKIPQESRFSFSLHFVICGIQRVCHVKK